MYHLFVHHLRALRRGLNVAVVARLEGPSPVRCTAGRAGEQVRHEGIYRARPTMAKWSSMSIVLIHMRRTIGSVEQSTGGAAILRKCVKKKRVARRVSWTSRKEERGGGDHLVAVEADV